MDPSSPATPPATKQDQPSPTQAAENEVVASLLLLKEAAGPEEDIDLDKKNHSVPDESTVEVNMDVEMEASHKTMLVASSLLQVDEFSADEALDEEEENEMLEQKEKYEALEQEGDDEDDDQDEEEVVEYDYPAVVITEEVRRCNRNNGRSWYCNELAEPGFATCLPHILSRRENYYKFQLRKLQDSTSRSGATVEPKIEDAATLGVGDQEEAAGPSSPGTLAGAK